MVRTGQRGRTARLLAVTVLVMVIVHLAGHLAGTPMIVLSPIGSLVLVVAARTAGLDWDALGMARAAARRGVRYAAPWIAVTILVYGGGLLLPATRPAFLDGRYRTGALVAALLLVPLATVLFEEVAFRGVLWGAVRELAGSRWATATSSTLFGCWHVLPALALATSNPVAARGSAWTAVGASVVATAAAGVVFCELRRRSGSLVAPMLVHWAINGLGILAAAWAWRTAHPS